VTRNKIVEYTSTSGTLGKAVTIGLTENDLQRLAYNESISFECAGATENDIFQLMLTLDRQFMAGIAYYGGIRKLGAGIIRVGPGLPAMQWDTINRLKPTVLVTVPSFLLRLIDFAREQGIDLNTSSVRKAICIGENLRSPDFTLSPIGKRIRTHWNIDLLSTYASTEMQTAFTECEQGMGGHHHPELIIVEILNENDSPVKTGEVGELTITTLGVEGMPLLRYKTGDMMQSFDESCSCGRTTMRLGPVVGRKQQMIKLKGTTLYPPGIFEVLNQIESVKDFAVEVFTSEAGVDHLKIYFVSNNQQQTEAALKSAFQSSLRVVPEICSCSQAEIDVLHSSGGTRKLQRFIDRRVYK
jgi:phenylacetate-CoA ligase